MVGAGRDSTSADNNEENTIDDGDVIRVEYEDVSNVELSIGAVGEEGNATASDGYNWETTVH